MKIFMPFRKGFGHKQETKTKIGIMLFIIILVVGLYIGSQVRKEANKIKPRVQEMVSGVLDITRVK